MPYLPLSTSRNRSTLIAALLIIEFLAILWLRDSGLSPTQLRHQQQQQRQRQSQDMKDRGQAQGKKIKGSIIKPASPRFLNGGAGVAPYHIHDEQWDFSMRAVRPERKRSEGSGDRKGSEKKLLSKIDYDHAHMEKKDPLDQQSSSMKPPPTAPPSQAPPIDISASPTPIQQNQQQRKEPAVLGQPPIEQRQGQHDQRAKIPEPAPSIGGAGITNTFDQQNGEGKERNASLTGPVKSKGDSNAAPNMASPKDSERPIKPTKDDKSEKGSFNREVSTNTSTSTSNKNVKDNSKLSKKQRQQRQQERQQRVHEKNQRGRFKSTEERKLAQLMPALDEYGVVIEDHFISPRDSDGDGVPDYYVLLRPSSSTDRDVGLFEDEVAKAPLPASFPIPPVVPLIIPAPNMQGQPVPEPSAQLTVVVKNETS